MGNNSNAAELRQEYLPITPAHSAISGAPCIVKSKKTGLELEEYIVSGTDRGITAEQYIYNLRSSSYSNSLVVVFHHFAID